jgi:hypothetical protein
MDAIQRENRDLRLIDDRRRDERTEAAGVREGVCAARELVGAEFSGADPLRHGLNAAGDPRQAQCLRAPQDRRDQPFKIQIHGDGEIHVGVQPQSLALDTCIEGGIRGKRPAGSVCYERQERQCDSEALAPRCFVLLACRNHATEVHFHRLQHMWAGRLRTHHMFGDAFSHPIERYEPLARCKHVRRRSCIPHACQDIAAANPAVAAAADDVRGIERVFAQKSAHRW